MLHNTSCLPPKPIDHGADTAGIIVEETLGIDVCCSEHSNLGRTPDGAEKV